MGTRRPSKVQHRCITFSNNLLVPVCPHHATHRLKQLSNRLLIPVPPETFLPAAGTVAAKHTASLCRHVRLKVKNVENAVFSITSEKCIVAEIVSRHLTLLNSKAFIWIPRPRHWAWYPVVT
jgi:hypothetical protein